MSLDEYWNGEPRLCRVYREAFRKRQSIENQMLWRQGRYVYDAILCCVPVLHAFSNSEAKPIEYPSEPYPMTAQEAKEAEERRERKNFENIKARLDALVEANKLKQEIKK